MKISCTKKHGFTLIELLVVVIIIGVLAAIAIPGYMRSVEKSKAAGAMQALSDIAKAEHDYFAAQSKYTNDFGDLTITMTDENTMDEAEYSSYATKHYIFNLDNNQELATAKRLGGDAPYTLYRLFDDPRIYCQPEGNKYCEMLDLPAGTFTHNIGAWQSCPGGVYPCSKSCARSTTSGYSCYGTYNEDGTFREKVCDSNGLCTTTQYNAKQQALNRIFCYSYDEEGECIGGDERIFDENGNLIGYHRLNYAAPDGSQGFVRTYDENGKLKTHITCKEWDNDTCISFFSGGRLYDYDEKGNLINQRFCYQWNEDKSCKQISTTTGTVYSYNGNTMDKATCTRWNKQGDCTKFQNGYIYTYDANGNQMSSVSCKNRDDSGNCTEYSSLLYVTTYDENGNKLSKIRCASQENASCTSYGGSGGEVYIYDSNRRMIASRSCSSWGSDGNCQSISNSGYVYNYDANGNQISQARCTLLRDDNTCATYGTSGYAYGYDENGNMTTYTNCHAWDANGNCTDGNQGCRELNADDSYSIYSC